MLDLSCFGLVALFSCRVAAETEGVTVIELRQYTLLPGKRDVLIDLFERCFIESQEACGIEIVGTFRDLDDETKFVWLRGFPSMEGRARSLQAFYGGPVWQRAREAANATMVDSDDVLLLRSGWDGSTFAVDVERPGVDAPEGGRRGMVEVGIVPLAEPAGAVHLREFRERVLPEIETAGGSLLACLVTESSQNTFPVLPIREGENVFTWVAGFAEDADSGAVADARAAVAAIVGGWPGVVEGGQALRLAPTRRSRLTGNSRDLGGLRG